MKACFEGSIVKMRMLLISHLKKVDQIMIMLGKFHPNGIAYDLILPRLVSAMGFTRWLKRTGFHYCGHVARVDYVPTRLINLHWARSVSGIRIFIFPMVRLY